MRIIDEHINTRLSDFIQLRGTEETIFREIFQNLKSELKEDYRQFLIYLLKILSLPNNEGEGLKPLHLHIEANFSDEEKTLIAEFFWMLFYQHEAEIGNSDSINHELKNRIEKLEIFIEEPIRLSSSNPFMTRSEKIQIKKDEIRAREKKKLCRKYLEFYKQIDSKASLSPKTLLNLKVGQEEELAQYFKYTPTYLNTKNINEPGSYSLYNTEPFSKIKGRKFRNKPLLTKITNIILYDCENSVTRFNQFNYRNLCDFNNNFDTNFKNLLIITLGKEELSLNTLRDRIKLIRDRFHLPKDCSYTITLEEINTLLSKERLNNIKVKFIGNDTSSFIENIFWTTKVNSLYELRSFKLLNYYSLCFNDEIKNYLLNGIFENVDSKIITEDAFRGLHEIEENDLTSLKDNIANLLESIIANWNNYNTSYFSKNNLIVVDDFIKNNNEFIKLLMDAIGISANRKFITWKDLDSANREISTIILSYRDLGGFYNHFYPNLIETKSNEKIKAIFNASLFKSNYHWALYNLQRDYYKTLKHPIRSNSFDWQILKAKIDSLRPERSLDLDWGLESDYSSSVDLDRYLLKLKNERKRTLVESDSIIYSDTEKSILRIKNISQLFEDINLNEDEYVGESLDKLLEIFNPVEKLIDTQQLEDDLNIIKTKYGLEENEAGRLWKILLKRKVDGEGLEKVYNNLNTQFQNNNITLVSLNHFERSWCNPNNDSLMPRGNKDFRILCDFLGLTIDYRRIMARIKNRTVSGKRKATRTFSKLLLDLFEDGCFDNDVKINEILESKKEHYIEHHNLEELGIDEANPVNGLTILIELLKPEIRLKKIEEIEKVNE